MHSDAAVDHPVVVIASERTDARPGWEEVAVGELVHIGPDLTVEREVIIDEPPSKPMVLSGHAARTQSYERD